MADVRGEPPLGLRERKKQRTRAMLMDAAVELCIRQGFERTTVDQIAAIADVSPRTFSRYFATKDAVIMAVVDDTIDMIADELKSLPPDVPPLEAMYRATIAVHHRTKNAPPGGMTSDRLVSTAWIVMSSPTLRQAVGEWRTHASHKVLAERMGVGLDDRRLKLVAGAWGTILMTALAELSGDIDLEHIRIDEIICRIEETYAEFLRLMEDVRQPV